MVRNDVPRYWLELLGDLFDAEADPPFEGLADFFGGGGDVDAPLGEFVDPLRARWITKRTSNTAGELITANNTSMIINSLSSSVMFSNDIPIIITINHNP